jgi:predicted nucleic acid-binding protein
MVVYLDTSTVLRRLLRQEKPLSIWGKWERGYSSEILGVEARRALDRLRLESALDDHGIAQAQEELSRLERAIGRIPLTRPVLERASMPMATAVRTLDAIHLASALLFRERKGTAIVFATHDAQQATAARALGFACLGV